VALAAALAVDVSGVWRAAAFKTQVSAPNQRSGSRSRGRAFKTPDYEPATRPDPRLAALLFRHGGWQGPRFNCVRSHTGPTPRWLTPHLVAALGLNITADAEVTMNGETGFGPPCRRHYVGAKSPRGDVVLENQQLCRPQMRDRRSIADGILRVDGLESKRVLVDFKKKSGLKSRDGAPRGGPSPGPSAFQPR